MAAAVSRLNAQRQRSGAALNAFGCGCGPLPTAPVHPRICARSSRLSHSCALVGWSDRRGAGMARQLSRAGPASDES